MKESLILEKSPGLLLLPQNKVSSVSDTDKCLSFILFEMHDNGGSVSFSHQLFYCFTILVYRELSWKYPYIFFTEVQAYFALCSVLHKYLEQLIPFSFYAMPLQSSNVLPFMLCFSGLKASSFSSSLWVHILRSVLYLLPSVHVCTLL